MAKKSKKKAPVKTMEELTKNFEEFIKKQDKCETTKEEFEKNLKKLVKKQSEK